MNIRLLLLLALNSILYAEPEVLEQKNVHKLACGPCALINQFQFGSEKERSILAKLKGGTPAQKAKEIIKRYGQRESPSLRDGRSVFRNDGVACPDMLRLANWVRRDKSLPELGGDYLDRGEDEELDDHLPRIHGKLKKSIDAGVMPIISLRAFGPKYYDELEEWLWDPLGSHFVTVTEVQEEIVKGEKGFRFRFADSATGKVETGYVHLSEARNFVAMRGDQRNWEWKKDRPFLLVTAPSLRLHTQKKEWFLRTIITLNYGIYFGGSDE